MPITLPVEGRADDRSFERVADRAEKRFAKAGKESGQAFAKGLDDAASKADPKSADRWVRAYDKVADAAGKVRVEEAKLADLRNRGANNTRLIAQSEALERARRAETRATREAASAYQDLGQRTSGLFASIGNLASGTRFGGMIADAQSLSSTFGGMGLAAGAAITGVAGLAVGIGMAANKLYDLGAMWDDVADSITGRTGKIGDELNAVMDQVVDVAISTAAPIAEIGDIAGRVSASLGATGDELGMLTAYIADLNALTGEQTSIRQLGMLYNVFNVEGQDQVAVLNQLYDSYTKTQIPINELIDTLVTAGPKVDDFGLSLGDTAALLASFTEAGVKPEAAVKGLTMALNNFAKAGKDPAEGLQQVIDKIREFERTGNTVAAQQLAVDVFGKKNAAEFIQVIEGGRVNLNNFATDQQGITTDIRETKEATNDWQEELQVLANYFQVGFKPIADATFNGINDNLRNMALGIVEKIGEIRVAIGGLREEGLFGPNSAIGQLWEIITGGNNSAGGGGGSWGDPASPGTPGSQVRGTPGKGFPMPWTLPPLTDAKPAAYEAGMVPNNVTMMSAIERMFPGVTLSADTGRNDKYGEHGSGEALDIMVGTNRALGDQVNQFLLQNADALGLQYTIWQQKTLYPDGRVVGMEDRGSPTQNHMDHVHARVKPGPATGMRNFAPPGRTVTQNASMFGPAPMSPSGGGFGPDYRPGPTGSTPGFNEMGDPGYYTPDPRQIRGAEERLADVNDAIADAKEQEREAQQRLTDSMFKRAQVEADILASDEDKAAANKAEAAARKAKDDASERLQRLQTRDLRDANEALADAQQGNFRTAQKAPGMSSSGGGFGGLGQIGAPIASDFGASGGLGGIAQNMTTFLANLGFAPMIGALSGVKAGFDPTGSAGSGLMGIMGALGGFGPGASTVGAASPFGIPGMGGGGGIAAGGNLFGGALGALPGPAQPGTTVGGITPAGGRGEGGLGVAGGLMGAAMSALSSAAGAGGMAVNGMAPGAGAAISAAADIGIKLANRGAQFAGQVGGIAAGGLMEGLLPVDSALADPMNSWFGRIVGGMMGATPNLPNMAGQAAAAPQGQAPGAAPTADGKPPITVNYTNNQATEDRAGADLTNHLMAMNMGPGTG